MQLVVVAVYVTTVQLNRATQKHANTMSIKKTIETIKLLWPHKLLWSHTEKILIRAACGICMFSLFLSFCQELHFPPTVSGHTCQVNWRPWVCLCTLPYPAYFPAFCSMNARKCSKNASHKRASGHVGFCFVQKSQSLPTQDSRGGM